MNRDPPGHSPARLSTLPGRWVIDLASASGTDPSIHIRKFRLPANADAGSSSVASGSGRREEPKAEDDLLDAAWKRINEGGGSEEGSDNLLGDCAVICSEKGQRFLWSFSANEHSDFELEGLEEIPKPSPVHIPHLISCTKHGLDPPCIVEQPTESHDKSCEVMFSPSPEVNGQLDLLGAALVEKMAWKAGFRIIMRPSINDIRPPLVSSLRPLTSNKLLLSLRPSLRPTSPAQPATSSHPLLLNPVLLPAIRLAASSLTPAQDALLTTKLDRSLGHTWKHGQHEAQTRSQLLGETYADWSIYWVPVLLEHLSSRQLEKMSLRQLAERWQKSQGVLTIWPTHLSEPYHIAKSTQITQPILPMQTKSNSSDLLDIASGVFDFLSTYREPPPPEEVEDEVEVEPLEEDVTMDGESTVGPDPILGTGEGAEHTQGEGSPRSDIDDLFSAHSDSPINAPEEMESASVPPPESLTTYMPETSLPKGEGIDDNPIQVDDFSLSVGRKPARRSPSRNGTEERPEPGEEMITEDDFAFFDSPTDHLDADPNFNSASVAADPFAGFGAGVPGPGGGMDVDLDELFGQLADDAGAPTQAQEEGLVAGQVVPLGKERTSPTDGPASAVDEDIPPASNVQGSTDTLIDAEPPETGDIDDQATGIDPLPPPPPPPVQLPPSPALSFPKRSWSTADLVPPSFSPLPLVPPVPQYTFAYSLPSPAPTPASLKEDLIERLRPPKSKNPTYADAWEMSSEPSDADEEEGYTGPPTPESTYSDESEEDARPVGKKNEDETVEFGGVECVASEWTRLIHDPEKAREIAIPWNQSWGTGSVTYPTPPPDIEAVADELKTSRLDGVDCTRFVKDLIMNRAVRDMVRRAGEEQAPLSRTKAEAEVSASIARLLSGGTSLSGLSNDKPRTLLQPQINAGYSNSVIRLSISALHYWGEIGLQPQGGLKEIEAMVVCEDNEYSRDAGASLAKSMRKAWEELRLGRHHIAEIGGASQGVVSVPSSVFPEAVANLLNQSQADTVIYVLLPRVSTTSSSLLRALFSLALAPSQSTVVHLIPPHAFTATAYRQIAMEVYERFPLLIHPVAHRSPDSWATNTALGLVSEDHQVPSHAFTLARARGETPKPEFSMSWPLRSYDVINVRRLVYSAYTYLEELGALVICAMDDLGQAFDIKVCASMQGVDWRARVKKVYEWITDMLGLWTSDGRLSVMRVGGMCVAELEAWKGVLDNSDRDTVLLMVDPFSSSGETDGEPVIRHRPLANIPNTTLHDPRSRLIDMNFSAQLSVLSTRIPVDLLDGKNQNQRQGSPEADDANEGNEVQTIYPDTSFMVTISTEQGSETKVYHVLDQSGGKSTESSELGQGLYRLTCLLRSRWDVDGLDDLLVVGGRGLEGLASAPARDY